MTSLRIPLSEQTTSIGLDFLDGGIDLSSVEKSHSKRSD
jgi:hypothetical protein